MSIYSEKLTDAINKLESQVKSKLRCQEILNVSDLTLKDLAIIEYVSVKNRSMGEISAYLNIPPSTLTSIIDRLMSKKILKRISDIYDKRKVYIVLGNFGKKIVELKKQISNQVSSMMLKGLDDKTTTTLLDILEKMNKNLEND